MKRGCRIKKYTRNSTKIDSPQREDEGLKRVQEIGLKKFAKQRFRLEKQTSEESLVRVDLNKLFFLMEA